jgi:glutamate racemase
MIGFLDSGIGGLSVLREALSLMPNEDYIYYGDTENTPYGTKTRDEVKRLTFNAASFLARRGIKALVVACNTATGAAVEDLRKAFEFPVIGMEPAVKPAVEKSHNGGKRVLVLATALALKTEKFQNLVSRVDTDHIVDILPAPKLVELAERYVFRGAEVEAYLKELLPESDIQRYDTLVLGCTHFPLFRKALSEYLPSGISIIDGNAGTINHLHDVLKSRNLLNPASEKGQVIFFKSGVQVTDGSTLENFNRILQVS